MSNHVASYVKNEASKPSLLSKIRDVGLPFIFQGVIRTFAVKHHTRISGNGSTFRAVAGQSHWTQHRFGCMNRGVVPTVIDDVRAAVPQFNLNPQVVGDES